MTELEKLDRDFRKALRLLRTARFCIVEEVNAAGPEEVKQNPKLKRHDRVCDEIGKFVDKFDLEI